MRKTIYLDYAAATPIDYQVSKCVREAESNAWANPSSIHKSGVNASIYIEKARAKVARFLSCSPAEIIFTASGSEANNLALFGAAHALKKFGNHILISSIEHESVKACAQVLAQQGFEVEIIPINSNGEIEVSEIGNRLKNTTIIVSIMAINNEIGVVFPIKEIGKIILKHNKIRIAKNLAPIFFHTDACQAAGLYALNVNILHVDALTLNSNKLYGPKGVGALFLRRGKFLTPIIYGGGQEKNLRSGTENIPGIVGFGFALSKAESYREQEFKRLSILHAYCLKKLKNIFPNITINGSAHFFSPHILNFTLKKIDAEAALLYLSEKGIELSSGPACAQKSGKESPTLKGLGLKSNEMRSTLRISFGRQTSKKDIDIFLKNLKEIYKFVSI